MLHIKLSVLEVAQKWQKYSYSKIETNDCQLKYYFKINLIFKALNLWKPWINVRRMSNGNNISARGRRFGSIWDRVSLLLISPPFKNSSSPYFPIYHNPQPFTLIGKFLGHFWGRFAGKLIQSSIGEFWGVTQAVLLENSSRPNVTYHV